MPFAVAAAAIGFVASEDASSAQEDATQAQSNAAAGQIGLGRDQLAFNQRIYDEGKAARDFALKNAQDTSGLQLKAMQFAIDQAQSDKQYNEGTFRPLEKGLVADATGYDTAQRRLDAAQAAQTDVNTAFNAQQGAAERELARAGVAPGSAKAMSVMADGQYAQATAAAGAGTQAVRNVEQQGYARRMDSAALGRNLPSNQATQQQIATTTGNSSTANAMQGVVAQQAGVPNVNVGYNGASSAFGSAGNLFGQSAGGYGQIAASNAQGIGQLGRAVGSSGAGNWMQSAFGGSTVPNWYAGMTSPPATDYYSQNGSDIGGLVLSDEKAKKNTGKKADGKQALAEVDALPVKEGWSYDPAKGGPDDGGVPHTGPMAQDVRKRMGAKVAPGGKVISTVDMNGKILSAMQELSRKVDRLEKRAA